MSYRDDSEALRERVETLEGELSAANETIARLTGKAATPRAPEEKANWLLGNPSRLILDEELPARASESAYAPIAEIFRARLPRVGQVSQVGRALSYRHGSLEITVTPTENGCTRLRLAANHSHLGMLTVASALVFMLLALPLVGATLGPAALIIAMPFVAILAFALTRPFVARQIQRNRAELAGVFDSVVAVIAQHGAPAIAPAASERVRVPGGMRVPDEVRETKTAADGEAAADDALADDDADRADAQRADTMRGSR